MKTWYINVMVLSVLASIAGWLGAFIYGVSGQYNEAMIMLVMAIVGAVCYTLASKVLEELR